MRNKLKSNTGASLTAALLLFLVCSVIGSVVLAAGTASAGRMSQLTATDQRYYSVTSAAGAFRDMLNGQSYTVERLQTATVTETETVTLDAAGRTTAVSHQKEVGEPVYSNLFYCAAKGGGTHAFSEGSSLLADVALYYVFGACEDYATAEAWASEPGQARTWNLRVEPGGTDALPVDVTVELAADGTLLLAFSNVGGADTYRMTMKLNAEVHDTSSAPTPEVTTEQTTATAALGGGAHSVTTTTVTRTVKTKMTTLTWTTEGRQW